MTAETYIVATIKPWNQTAYHQTIRHFPGNWHLIDTPSQLTPERIQQLAPRYIFFPHWSHLVPDAILQLAECVCFHETDLPYGRGGSPIQNLIARGHKTTVMTALQMTNTLDAGPVYLKRPLSLEGTAADIFNRAAKLSAQMIGEIVQTHPAPTPQQGEVVTFKRRTPGQSRITAALTTPEQLYDHIRMLDAPTYPRAFMEADNKRYEFSDPTLNGDTISAQVYITPIKDKTDD